MTEEVFNAIVLEALERELDELRSETRAAQAAGAVLTTAATALDSANSAMKDAANQIEAVARSAGTASAGLKSLDMDALNARFASLDEAVKAAHTAAGDVCSKLQEFDQRSAQRATQINSDVSGALTLFRKNVSEDLTALKGRVDKVSTDLDGALSHRDEQKNQLANLIGTAADRKSVQQVSERLDALKERTASGHSKLTALLMLNLVVAIIAGLIN